MSQPHSEQIPELAFVRPLPGFAQFTRYALVQLDDPADLEGGAGVLYELRSVEDPAVRFLVGVPTVFFADYIFEIDEALCRDLELGDASDALVLVVLTVGSDSASTTANLLAPVVINARTRSAAQVILSGTDWPVRAAIG